MLQRVHLVRDRKTEKWREARKNEPLHEPQPFTEWLAEGRPPQTLVEADTARLNGIEIEQIVDILARDGAVELARRVRDEGVGTRVRGGVVVDGFVAFGEVRKLIATEPEAVTASAALKEVRGAPAQAKDLRTSLGERMIVGAAAHGGVEGLRDSMAPVLEISIGALERAIVALAQQPSAESERRAAGSRRRFGTRRVQVRRGSAHGDQPHRAAALGSGSSARTRRTPLFTQGAQWTNAKVTDRLLLGNDRPDPTTLSVLSKRNLETLHKEVDPPPERR